MNELLSRVTIDQEMCHGKPAIRRLRQLVEAMREYLADGDTFEGLPAEFPDLERDDLRACLEFAAQSLKLKSPHELTALKNINNFHSAPCPIRARKAKVMGRKAVPEMPA